MLRIRCFLVRPTERAALYLRRFSFSHDPDDTRGHFHSAKSTRFRIVDVSVDDDGVWSVAPQFISHAEDAWPTKCSCGYEFTDEDEWQEFSDRIYESVDPGGGEWPHRELPVGAIFLCGWMSQSFWWDDSDDPCLIVKIPGGEWNVDSRATNCTLPDDRNHRCWVAHGVIPNITVDKNGKTCSAGAGSVMLGGWHGFLRDGYLEEC